MRDGALTRSQGRPGSGYFIASWADKWKEQNKVSYILDRIGRQDLTSTQIMLLKYNQSHEMPPKFSPKLLQNAICRVDLVRFRAVICFWEFELQRSPHYSTKVIIWRNILFILNSKKIAVESDCQRTVRTFTWVFQIIFTLRYNAQIQTVLQHLKMLLHSWLSDW